MRSGKTISALIAVSLMALLVTSLPALGQEPEYEEYLRPGLEDPLAGYTRSDGTLILRNQDFCSYLLGSLWGADTLTFTDLIDRSKKQKKARKAAFAPSTDPELLQQCADVLDAFRIRPPEEEDPLAAWARSGPVVPEALAHLLPADLLNDPLAEPGPIGDGSRTSGFGDLFSAPFGLTGGTYFVQVDDRDCPFWSGALRGARDPSLAFDVADARAYLYDVAPANYYWDVSAPGCDWSVDLVAVDLGPEPTATPVPKAVVPQLHLANWKANQSNPEFLGAQAAREAVLEAGLVTGDCTEQKKSANTRVFPQRVWAQDPPAGTLVEFGSAVDVWIGQDCDIFTGDRVVVE